MVVGRPQRFADGDRDRARRPATWAITAWRSKAELTKVKSRSTQLAAASATIEPP